MLLDVYNFLILLYMLMLMSFVLMFNYNEENNNGVAHTLIS